MDYKLNYEHLCMYKTLPLLQYSLNNFNSSLNHTYTHIYRPGALPEQVVRLLMCDCACACKHTN